MRAAIECIYENETITIGEALNLRDQGGNNLKFLCVECGEDLRAHRAGETIAAHFEHLQRNYSCSFSAGVLSTYYDIDDVRAIEGYEIDKKLTTHARNSKLVIECKKRDEYRCQACNFRLKVHEKYVIECHHTKPVALNGEREVSLDELVCLCPTCHRIAHTRLEPLDIAEIKQVRGIS